MEYGTLAILAGIAALAFLLKDVIFNLLGISAKKTAEATKKKDEEIQKDQQKLREEALVAKTQADSLGNQAQNPQSDEDWHKRRN